MFILFLTVFIDLTIIFNNSIFSVYRAETLFSGNISVLIIMTSQ